MRLKRLPENTQTFTVWYTRCCAFLSLDFTLIASSALLQYRKSGQKTVQMRHKCDEANFELAKHVQRKFEVDMEAAD